MKQDIKYIQRQYTQRQWDCEVGWGTVPDEYAFNSFKPDAEDEIVIIEFKE